MSTLNEPDSLGWQIVQEHSPFFRPTDLAGAIDRAIELERLKSQSQILKEVWNKTQPDIIPQGAHETEEAVYIKARIAELDTQIQAIERRNP